MEILDLPPEKRKQLDTGVALRRYASHLNELQEALERKKSVLITPVTRNSIARLFVDTPSEHAKLRKEPT